MQLARDAIILFLHMRRTRLEQRLSCAVCFSGCILNEYFDADVALAALLPLRSQAPDACHCSARRLLDCPQFVVTFSSRVVLFSLMYRTLDAFSSTRGHRETYEKLV